MFTSRYVHASTRMLWVVLAIAASGCSPRYAGTMPQVSNLFNTHWRVIEIGGREATFSQGQKMDVHFILSPSGNVRGSTGCNNLMGSFSRKGQRLRFGALATTKMACSPAVMSQERGFLNALDRTSTFEIDGRRLKLYDAGGDVVMRCLGVYIR